MAGHVCPWWGGYFIDNPLRRLVHKPEKIFGPYLRPGMDVMDVGCGMGLFSIAMAKMVGSEGRVIAVDLQPKMLEAVARRAHRAGVADWIQLHRCEADNLGLAVNVDFALAFAMVHEVPDTRRFLEQVHGCLKPGGKFFVAEPRLHVRAAKFEAMVKIAEDLGFTLLEQPRVRWSQAAVFAKR